MSTYLSFLAATLVLLLIPGPAVLFIVGRSLEQGTKAGIVSVAGITLGGLVHVAFAVLGLSAVLAASSLAFSTLKYAGAAYLIYLGLAKLWNRNQNPSVAMAPEVQGSRLFWQGFTVQILNPKVALFFLSFLPQFVDLSRGSAALQMLGLGLCFVAIAFVTDSLYAWLAGTFAAAINGNTSLPGLARWASGLTYLTLGVAAASGGPGKVSK
jgi:threonine/homoserine/homoserine lactone efflux protein